MAARVTAPRHIGVLVALAIVSAWSMHLIYVLRSPVSPYAAPLHVVLQAWLSVGLFITAHDAMHGVISRNRWLNHGLGALAAFLFAGFSYGALQKNHRLHHLAPATDEDPDYHARNPHYLPWFLSFLWRYATWSQVLIMGIAYNLLARVADLPEPRLWLFWILPLFIAAAQLFYFGTYLPHRPPVTSRMAPHNARSQDGGHLWALLSCFFFGYHWEHHERPATPWWNLWRLKDQL